MEYEFTPLALNAYINKLGRAEINEFGMQLKKLESEQIKNPQMKTKLEILKEMWKQTKWSKFIYHK